MFDDRSNGKCQPKLVRATIALLISFTTCGCGIVSIPQFDTYPHHSLRRIRVVDFNTQEPINDANVVFVLRKWENWMLPRPWWAIGDSSRFDTAGSLAENDLEQNTWSWNADKVSDGLYEIPARTKWGWITIWCPLPPVLGCFMYDTYDGAVSVSAPNYRSIYFSNELPHISGDMNHYSRGKEDPNETFLIIENDYIHVSLPRK